jgi:hypothetical protein
MVILQKLTDLGFTQATVTGEAKGISTVRVRTSKGWVYDRFASDEAVERWANFHQPESEA